MKERVITITHKFDASPVQIFEAFSQPEHIGKWWGPNGFSTTTKKMKFEVGGEWIFTMHGPDGTNFPNRVVYTEINKPMLLKYDHFEGYEDNEKPPHFKAKITFEAVNGKTKVEMFMVFPTSEKRKEAAEYGAVEGGNQTMARLDEFIQAST